MLTILNLVPLGRTILGDDELDMKVIGCNIAIIERGVDMADEMNQR
jgi:hypothetical protein